MSKLDGYFAGYEDDDFEDEGMVVCTEHLRFVPCRKCDAEVAARMSSDPADVERVRRYQQGD